MRLKNKKGWLRYEYLFFTKYEISWGSSRERIGVYLRFLEEKSFTYKIISCIPTNLSQIWIGKKGQGLLLRKIYSFWHSRILKNLKFIWLICIAKRFDVILIQKINLIYPLVYILTLRNKNIVFDFDDQCFKNTQYPAILKLYKCIIAGNKYLAEIAVGVRGTDNTFIIPTPIDCNLYFPKENPSESASITIGWAGSGENHLRHLQLLVNPLKELQRQFDFTFKLVGAMYSKKIKELFGFLDHRFVCIDWIDNLYHLPMIIQTFDIGVMPLKDDAESRGKCGFKTLQYMASGVPVVISPVGVNNDIVRNGINGFLAKEEHEWIEKLATLIQDKELRRKFAKRGRITVEELYSLEKTASRFIEILNTAKKYESFIHRPISY